MLNIIARNIRTIRKEQGLSQEDLALKAGVDRSYLGYVENGKHNITILKLQQIANALNLEIVDLITDSYT